MTGKRKKKLTHIDFGAHKQTSSTAVPIPGTAAGSSLPAAVPIPGTAAGGLYTKRVLREKTSVAQDGKVRQSRTIVNVAPGDEQPTTKLHPDIRRVREPIYELYSSADHGGDDWDDDDAEGGRNLRDSVSVRDTDVARALTVPCCAGRPSPTVG